MERLIFLWDEIDDLVGRGRIFLQLAASQVFGKRA
jgi:hypothetical protein